MKAKITATIELEYEFDESDYEELGDDLLAAIERDVDEGNIVLDDATVSNIEVKLIPDPEAKA